MLLVAEGSSTDFIQEIRSIWDGQKASHLLSAKRQLQLAKDPQLTNFKQYFAVRAARHTISGSASIEDAAKQMEREKLTFLVVLDSSSRSHSAMDESSTIGLINERAFLRADVSNNFAAPVASMMTPLYQLVRAKLNDSVSHCADIFFKHNVRHLPIIEGERLCGIISLRDLLRPIIANQCLSALGTGRVHCA